MIVEKIPPIEAREEPTYPSVINDSNIQLEFEQILAKERAEYKPNRNSDQLFDIDYESSMTLTVGNFDYELLWQFDPGNVDLILDADMNSVPMDSMPMGKCPDSSDFMEMRR
jgi:hypothetical protein